MSEFFLAHAKADRALKSVVSEVIQKSSLSMTEWLALAVIANGPREGTRMGVVAEMLNVTLPQVTALATDLIEKKLCKQHVYVDDRRGRLVLPTLKGRRLLGNLELDMHDLMQKRFSDMDPVQVKSYLDVTHYLSGEMAPDSR